MGARIRGTLKDIDALNKVPFKRAISRVKQGPRYGYDTCQGGRSDEILGVSLPSKVSILPLSFWEPDFTVA